MMHETIIAAPTRSQDATRAYYESEGGRRVTQGGVPCKVYSRPRSQATREVIDRMALAIAGECDWVPHPDLPGFSFTPADAANNSTKAVKASAGPAVRASYDRAYYADGCRVVIDGVPMKVASKPTKNRMAMLRENDSFAPVPDQIHRYANGYDPADSYRFSSERCEARYAAAMEEMRAAMTEAAPIEAPAVQLDIMDAPAAPIVAIEAPAPVVEQAERPRVRLRLIQGEAVEACPPVVEMVEAEAVAAPVVANAALPFFRACSGQGANGRGWSVCITESTLCPWWRPVTDAGNMRVWRKAERAEKEAARLNALIRPALPSLAAMIEAARGRADGTDCSRREFGLAVSAAIGGSAPGSLSAPAVAIAEPAALEPVAVEASAPLQAASTESPDMPTDTAETSTAAPADDNAALLERIAKLESVVDDLMVIALREAPAPTVPDHGNDAPAPLPSDPRARAVVTQRDARAVEMVDLARAKRLRVVRRYLAMRAERQTMRERLAAMHQAAGEATAAAVQAEDRAQAKVVQASRDAATWKARAIAAGYVDPNGVSGIWKLYREHQASRGTVAMEGMAR